MIEQTRSKLDQINTYWQLYNEFNEIILPCRSCPFSTTKILQHISQNHRYKSRLIEKSRQNVTNDIKTDYTVSMMSATDDYIVVVVVDDVSYIYIIIEFPFKEPYKPYDKLLILYLTWQTISLLIFLFPLFKRDPLAMLVRESVTTNVYGWMLIMKTQERNNEEKEIGWRQYYRHTTRTYPCPFYTQTT